MGYIDFHECLLNVKCVPHALHTLSHSPPQTSRGEKLRIAPSDKVGGAGAPSQSALLSSLCYKALHCAGTRETDEWPRNSQVCLTLYGY